MAIIKTFLQELKFMAKNKIEANNLLDEQFKECIKTLNNLHASLETFQNINLVTDQLDAVLMQLDQVDKSPEEVDSDPDVEEDEAEIKSSTLFLKPDITLKIEGYIYNHADGSIKEISYELSDLHCPVKRQEVMELLKIYKADLKNIPGTELNNLYNLLKNAENQF